MKRRSDISVDNYFARFCNQNVAFALVNYEKSYFTVLENERNTNFPH